MAGPLQVRYLRLIIATNSSDSDLWTKENRYAIDQVVKHTFSDLASIFKRTASNIVHCYYNLYQPIENRVNLAAFWGPKITDLLQEWCFTDTERLVSVIEHASL